MEENETNDDHMEKQEQIAQLFTLCDWWLIGHVDNRKFIGESLRLRQALTATSWSLGESGKEKRLFSAFNHAVQCALAVTQAIEDLEVKAWTATPPSTVRAYYFGQRVSLETILEMEMALKID